MLHAFVFTEPLSKNTSGPTVSALTRTLGKPLIYKEKFTCNLSLLEIPGAACLWTWSSTARVTVTLLNS